MNIIEINTHSPEETSALSMRIGERVQPGMVITLEGDLGAGKTLFTKGLAKGMGITRNVNSPTFTIIKEYMGRLPLYHMDVYRVEDEYEDLGFDDYFEGNGVTVVEWAHLIADQLPDELLAIHIQYIDETNRKITFKPVGDRYVELCKEILI
ncbi:tRNA (adenosine(37)-N6)-threonylcarbamoyltransferase complex ATPase subunit type 1 TsaE [Bacillus sp. 1P06AnD]|uniref:tRNA (adenosine(37)-N6)-threonylcarbamoyltransferase complex ATPase subunit type 1 TsaE n=1 Tax=Bacillus sp. 1P06AnD TaxID=3132208 RepID=UPI0039A036E6